MFPLLEMARAKIRPGELSRASQVVTTADTTVLPRGGPG